MSAEGWQNIWSVLRSIPVCGGLSTVERIERVDRLVCAIAETDPEDAAPILDAALRSWSVGGPGLALLLELDEDAEWWAAVAPAGEVAAYVAAGLRRLKVTPLHVALRKQLLVSLWHSMPEADRRAFLGRVDPTGSFVARSAS